MIEADSLHYGLKQYNDDFSLHNKNQWIGIYGKNGLLTRSICHYKIDRS
jgi:hypothetical protein